MKMFLSVFFAGLAVIAASADDFVVDVAEGTTNNVTEAVGASYTRIVKKGAGGAVFSIPSPAFTGSVEIEAGTLILKDFVALGKTSPVNVRDGATLLISTSSASADSSAQANFRGHEVTIAGSGVDGRGAFNYDGSTTINNLVSKMVLSADATVGVDRRWGIDAWSILDLASHTLTKVGAGQFMVYGKMTAGHIRTLQGDIVFQGDSFTTEGNSDDSSVIVEKGRLVAWDFATSGYDYLPVPVVVNTNGSIYVGSGYNANRNKYGDIILTGNGNTSINFENKSNRAYIPVINVFGMITNRAQASLSLDASGPGVMNMHGPVYLNQKNVNFNAKTEEVNLYGDESREVYNYYQRGGILTIHDGTFKVNNMVRIANGGWSCGVTRILDGEFISAPKKQWGTVDTGFIGEHNQTRGVFYIEGGSVTFSNSVRVGSSTDSFGAIIQKGGLFNMEFGEGNSGTTLSLGGKQSRTSGYSVGLLYQSGGTNDTRLSSSENGIRFMTTDYARLNEDELAAGVSSSCDTFMTITGSNTLFVTEQIRMGDWNRPGYTNCWSTNLINLADGGTLAAHRFFKASNDVNNVILNADGGVLKPTFGYGWCGHDAGTGEFFVRAPNHVVLYENGLTIDSSAAASSVGSGDPNSLTSTFINFSPEDAAGDGIATITLPADALVSGKYFMPAHIRIVGNGFGASAFADYDFKEKKLSNVIITSAGCNYDQEKTKVYLESPDRQSLYECEFTLRKNVPGPMRFRGKAGIQLCGEAKWTAGTIVDGIKVLAWATNALPQNTAYTLKNKGQIWLNATPLTVSSVGGHGSIDNAPVTVTGKIVLSCDELFGGKALAFDDKLILNDGVKFEIMDPRES